MILGRCALRGFGPLQAEVAIDFATLPPGIIALVGDNGTGKSHFIEATLPAWAYREWPSYREPTGKRGEELAYHVPPTVRDAYIDQHFTMGTIAYRARTLVDGKTGKIESYLFRGDDPTAIAGPHWRAFQETLALILPSRDAALAGPFACQHGHEGFFRLAPARRKDLFVEMLGCGHLQMLAEAAAGEESQALTALETVRAEMAQLEGRVARARLVVAELLALTPALAAQRVTAEEARGAERHARAQEAMAREELIRAEGAAAAVREHFERVAVDHRQATETLDARQARLVELDQLLAEAETIREAARALPAVEGALAAARETERLALETLAPIQTQIATLLAEREALVTEYARAKKDCEAAQAAIDRLVALEPVADARRTARERLTQVEDALALLASREQALVTAADDERTADQQRQTLERRLGDLAPRQQALADIPNVPACAACPLTANARGAVELLQQIRAELETVPAASQEAREALTAARTDRARLENDRQTLQRTVDEHVAQLASVDALRTEAAEHHRCVALRQDIAARGQAKSAAIGEAQETRERLEEALATARAARVALETQRSELAVPAARLAALTASEAQRTEVQQAIAELEATVTRIAAEQSSKVGVDVESPRQAVAVAQATVATAERAAGAADAAVQATAGAIARLEGEQQGLGQPEDELAALVARETTLLTEAADWAVLRRGLGRNGVQALLVDAAGPEVATIANDLIAECYDPRFQIRLETLVPLANGKGMQEVFEPHLIDSQAGREGTRGSGGEMALIEAALRLAIAIVNGRYSGFAMQTLWLDEPTSALSPPNAHRYVAMIRMAMARGGFHQALLVSHQQDVWESADARIVFDDDGVRVWTPATPGSGAAPGAQEAA